MQLGLWFSASITSRQRFPKATAGAHLDAFARRALWQQGLDFDHGTGHGAAQVIAANGILKMARHHVHLSPVRLLDQLQKQLVCCAPNGFLACPMTTSAYVRYVPLQFSLVCASCILCVSFAPMADR